MRTRVFHVVGCALLGMVLANRAAAQAGQYTGAWRNLTFSSTGPAVADVAINGNTLNFSLDLGGNVFGGSDPPALNLTGVIAPDNSVVFTPVTGHPTYGNVTGSVTSGGLITATGTNIPSPQIATFGLTGQFMPGAIDMDYVVTFSPLGGGGTANGEIELDLVPEPGVIALGAAAMAMLGMRRRRA